MWWDGIGIMVTILMMWFGGDGKVGYCAGDGVDDIDDRSNGSGDFEEMVMIVMMGFMVDRDGDGDGDDGSNGCCW